MQVNAVQTSIESLDFPIEAVREQFPAIRANSGYAFFDNAAGAQAPQSVLDAVSNHLLRRNVQRGGRYRESREVDQSIASARETVGYFVNAYSSDEIAFGLNATSFIRTISLAVGQTLGDRPEIIVTDLDHEANVATWRALQREGARMVEWRMRDDGFLHAEDLESLLSRRTRLVACTLASNALGSITDIAAVAQRAHAVGAELFVDAVHYGPHGVFDVRAWGCDYLVCSGYKIFAPHMGFMWGKMEALRGLPTFREDFIPDAPPYKIEAGTYTYENVAGMDAAVQYVEWLGNIVAPAAGSRRANIVGAMHAVTAYEQALSRATLKVLKSVAGLRIYGSDDPERVSRRTPTFSFTIDGISPADICDRLAREGFAVRDGHMYSPRLMRRLGLEEDSGTVRISLVHYNTLDEITRFGAALRRVAGQPA